MRTKFVRTARSELRFCLFVILLLLLLQLVSIRNEDLQTNPNLTRLWLQAGNHHSIVWWNPLSVLIQQTFTGNHYRNLVASAGRYCRPFATAYPFDTTVNHDSQSPADSLVDSAQDRLTDCDQLSQSLDTSRTDSSDNSLDILLPELLIETEPVQLMNELLIQLTRIPRPKSILFPLRELLPI